MVKTQFDKLKS